MVPTPDAAASRTSELPIARWLFCALLVFHFWGATRGWQSSSLSCNGFREAQTALSAEFIQRDGDFALAYPTPVLGKPWSVPMEFPLYQWAVVKLSDVAGVGLIPAGRAIGLACFYLCLPAFHLLLRRAGFTPARSLVALGLVLCSPLYLFYARAFLIETMALMFSAWFLVCHLRAAETHRPGWALTAIAAGAAAGLVKVTTLIVVLLPAASWSAAGVYRAWRATRAEDRKRGLKTAAWGLAMALPVVAISWWWVRFADGIKARSVAGDFLRSANLTGFNWGTGVRFSGELWQQHVAIVLRELISIPVAVAGVAAGIFASRRERLWALAAVAWFLAVQLMFPALYAYHAYYYVACGFAALLALGIVLGGTLDARWPRGVAWAAIAAICAWQGATFWRLHRAELAEMVPGNAQAVEAIRQVTGAEEVLVAAGDDWSSVLPFYTSRRALMVRRGLEHDRGFLSRAFAELKGERIGAVVLMNDQRGNRDLLELARDSFQIDPRPAFTWYGTAVHVPIERRPEIVRRFLARADLPNIEVPDWTESLPGRTVAWPEVPVRYRSWWESFSPKPEKFRFRFGSGTGEFGGERCLMAHAETKLWFRLPAGHHEFAIEAGMLPGAYDEKIPAAQRSDGVAITLREESPADDGRLFMERQLDPVHEPADRGLLRMEGGFELEREAVVVLTVGPGPRDNPVRDWVELARVEFR